MKMPGSVPTGTINRVATEVYDGYRRGRDSACVDMIICTRTAEGTPAALLSLRSQGTSFGGRWWVYGGALQAYQPVGEFIADRVEQECGIRRFPEVLIGAYRTCAWDRVASTVQLCYAAQVSIEMVQEQMCTDSDHKEARIFRLADLQHIPAKEQHWYPMRVVQLALKNMP